jgi:hypothetical protein
LLLLQQQAYGLGGAPVIGGAPQSEGDVTLVSLQVGGLAAVGGSLCP